MKQIIVHVGGLTNDEKQRVNEALAKLVNISKIEKVTTDMAWFYAPSTLGMQVGWNSILKSETPSHTPQQVLEMAGEQGHPLAELMAQYAEDAKTHAEPWKLWQYKVKDGDWCDCPRSPHWRVTTEYRRKPKTKLVHGVEVPVFDFVPCKGNEYFIVDITAPDLIRLMFMPARDCKVAELMYSRGLTYPYTTEGRQAAILHARAMLNIE